MLILQGEGICGKVCSKLVVSNALKNYFILLIMEGQNAIRKSHKTEQCVLEMQR